MKIIPVLDILNGVVVRAVAGKRDKYRPVISELTESRDPSVVLGAMKAAIDFDECYIADLDAILNRQLNRCTIAELTRHDGSLMVDRGVRCEEDARELFDLGVSKVVLPTETLPDLQLANQLLTGFGSDSMVVSIDLRNGLVLSENSSWKHAQPVELAQKFIDAGFEQFIVLDMAAVGTSAGIPTLSVCQQIRAQSANVRIITGGGVRNAEDLAGARASGVDAVLVASALHDRRLTTQEITSCQR